MNDIYSSKSKVRNRIISCLTILMMVMSIVVFTPSEVNAASGLKKPTLKNAVVSGSQITAKWKKVSNAKGYQLVIDKQDGSSYTTAYSKNTKKKTLTTDTLADGTYRVRVRAYKTYKAKQKKYYNTETKAWQTTKIKGAKTKTVKVTKKKYGKYSSAKYVTISTGSAASDTSGSSGSGSSDSSGDEDTDTGYTVTFAGDSGVSSINVFYTQDYTNVSENITATGTAVSRNSDTGNPDSTGDGQINFQVVLADGYSVSSVKATDGTYKNIKSVSDLSDLYRITKITAATTVTIATSKSSDDDSGDDESAFVTTSDGTVTSSTSSGVTTWAITAAGTYNFAGEVSNTIVTVKKGLSGVNLVLGDMTVDNSSMTTSDPFIEMKKSTSVTVTLDGSATIKGGSGSAKALIYQNADSNDSTISFGGDEDGELNLYCEADNVDGIRSKGTMTVTGGTYNIDVYGDGIQAWTLDIQDGEFDIDTHFSNAGLNYYNSALASTSLDTYNTLKVSETSSAKTKVETVNIDTGSHKGIKAGTKANTYSYTSVEDGSDYEAGTAYSEKASGGLTISGGTIYVDTTDTGIKYNAQSGSGNLTTVDDKVILGAPEDGIKSNNDCTITGGIINVASPDDGISVAGTLTVTGSSLVNVTNAYEGIEASTIVVGSGSDSPEISVYTHDDGINAAGKDSITYVYADEDEERYTKTSVSSMTGHNMTVNSGSVTVEIGDDTSHSYVLPVATGYGIVTDGTSVTGTYSSNGDGIDCNGSLYLKGGKTVIWGSDSSDNSPVDTADNSGAYEISAGAEVLATANSGHMANNPTSLGQCAVVYSGTSISAGTIYIKNGSTTLATATAPKSFSYLMYSSNELTSGTSYNLYLGSTSKASATASASISGGGGSSGGGGNPGGGDGPGGGNTPPNM